MNKGDLFDTNNWGQIKILDFVKLNSKSKILIEFINSKNKYIVFKSCILKGTIEDSIEKEKKRKEKRYFQKCCNDYLIIIDKEKEYNHNKKEFYYKVKFDTQNYETFASFNDIQKGQVNNPYIVSVNNIGFIGEGKYSYSKNKDIHEKWSNILGRCYNIKNLRYYCYGAKDIRVCNEWFNFQIFAKWYEENSYIKKLSVDKDILANINHLETKIYSPETCLLIPEELNCFLAGDNLNTGIEQRNNKFRAVCNRKYLGTYNTFQEAKQIYAKEKYTIWKELINKYNLPNDLKEILLKYDFSWYWLNK